jgi:iron complex outermembrane receptor protein
LRGDLQQRIGACAAAWLALAGPTAWAQGGPAAAADSAAAAAAPDTVYTLPPSVVRARRPTASDRVERLPGSATVVEMASERDRLTTTAEVLDRVPGLHVSRFGGLGDFATVSIRGSGPNQVSLYLDGVPLARAGLGVANLADLPFAGVERVEVYRGFAPAELAGASLGGAVNLVTRTASPRGPVLRRSCLVAGLGSFGTRRLGFTQELAGRGWSGLLAADHLESDGDFEFHDDDGTHLTTAGDEIVPRRNNASRADEVLFRVGRALPAGGELALVNQWVDRRHGVPGLSSYQSDAARSGATYDVASAEVRFPGLARGRLSTRARVFGEWRRDTFADLENEIGLGYQDNRDETWSRGAQAGLRLHVPVLHAVELGAESRRERFEPWRRLPELVTGPAQERRTLELACEQHRTWAWNLTLHAGLRWARESDDFSGDLRNPYSPRPARAVQRTFTEPRLGARWVLARGLAVRGTYGRYHRTPGFLELFGDAGSVAGSSDLVPEEGTNRDVGLQLAGSRFGLEAELAAARFHNTVDHLITFIPQSQQTFVARNIGAARMRGEEWSWHLAAAPRDGRPPRFAIDGSWTHLDARDLGVDRSWYAGMVLPLRPAHEVHQRAALRLGRAEIGWEYDHVSRNMLDRWNSKVVSRRDLHALDLRLGFGSTSLQLELRNLTGERATDVAGFPLPGRTLSSTISYRL